MKQRCSEATPLAQKRKKVVVSNTRMLGDGQVGGAAPTEVAEPIIGVLARLLNAAIGTATPLSAEAPGRVERRIASGDGGGETERIRCCHGWSRFHRQPPRRPADRGRAASAGC